MTVAANLCSKCRKEIPPFPPGLLTDRIITGGLCQECFQHVAESGMPLADFLDLVQRLRETESSLYTKRDTPMFTCRRMAPAEASWRDNRARASSTNVLLAAPRKRQRSVSETLRICASSVSGLSTSAM